jgi:hypothetical protein
MCVSAALPSLIMIACIDKLFPSLNMSFVHLTVCVLQNYIKNIHFCDVSVFATFLHIVAGI